MMSVHMEQAADAILQAAGQTSSPDDLSDVDVDVDGSSSLSDIDDRDNDQDEELEGSDELSNPSDDDNDSEAETERLEESPNKFRPHQDVVLNSHNNQTYEKTPSKLHKQLTVDDLEAEEPLSDDDISVNEYPESPKSLIDEEAEPNNATAPTSLEDSSVENKALLSTGDADSRKRKRSIMGGGGLDADLDEPSRKRTGSVMTPADEYAIEDDINADDEVEAVNPDSGDISGDEGGDLAEDKSGEDVEELTVAEDEPSEAVDTPTSPKRRGRKKKKALENGELAHAELESSLDARALNGHEESRNGDETADNEGEDETEAALKNEEELEKKRVALEQLSAFERQFTIFRDRLYDERLDQLNREEAMLRQSKPTHPEYLAMMQCIDARRDERFRIGDKLRGYGFQTVKTFAVAKRSQILAQYQQEVRDIRETKLEQLGKQWYEIQHDRRSYAGNVSDYTIKFPKRRSQQIMNQVAYSNEVSILSGVAKYVGFPAAPRMAPATMAEMEDDFEKMGRTKQAQQAPIAALPLQELAALRTAGSTSRFKPAEEQFIEQTPWANPHHPSHAHLIQRQAPAQQTPRTASPFAHGGPSRRHSHQLNGPISGTFSSTPSTLNGQNVPTSNGGRTSPLNPFTAPHSHAIAPSPLGSRQTSLSPQQRRPSAAAIPEQKQNMPNSPDIAIKSPPGHLQDFQQGLRREHTAAFMS